MTASKIRTPRVTCRLTEANGKTKLTVAYFSLNLLFTKVPLYLLSEKSFNLDQNRTAACKGGLTGTVKEDGALSHLQAERKKIGQDPCVSGGVLPRVEGSSGSQSLEVFLFCSTPIGRGKLCSLHTQVTASVHLADCPSHSWSPKAVKAVFDEV